MLPDARVETVKTTAPELAASIRKATVRLLS
jgi:uncharacterized protein